MWGGGSVAILGIIYDKVLHSNYLVNNGNPTILYIWLVGLGALVNLVRIHIRFQRAVEESKARTRDINYRQMLGI